MSVFSRPRVRDKREFALQKAFFRLLYFAMKTRKNRIFSIAPGLFIFMFAVTVVQAPVASPATSTPFLPGEKLTYNLSWSNIISAGIAVMEVKDEPSKDEGNRLRFVSIAHSVGIVDKFYPVRDIIQSVFDADARDSLLYTVDQSHGKRKKKREYVFDQVQHKVTYTENGVKAVLDIPPHVQDALSALYYVRMSNDLVPGRTITVHVHDGGKNWAVDINVLSREKINTPLGDFNTIKIKTYPKYEGVFIHKGEIYIWLTDDSHRVPVLMKSTITIGSIMATLTEMKLGEGN
jgi:hypothetical protein